MIDCEKKCNNENRFFGLWRKAIVTIIDWIFLADFFIQTKTLFKICDIKYNMYVLSLEPTWIPKQNFHDL